MVLGDKKNKAASGFVLCESKLRTCVRAVQPLL